MVETAGGLPPEQYMIQQGKERRGHRLSIESDLWDARTFDYLKKSQKRKSDDGSQKSGSCKVKASRVESAARRGRSPRSRTPR
ncbi:unnamed protein product [Caenorhabditis auriculariae]|uniref:Uncharacterized protein n=1 Tax=Caenorhabditis auriculariae TaxID=2777116 RepID=A0A8S1HDB1_9PELO|nr:unnamed protein product [Caenorhabditis auriculariae]